MEGGGSRSFPKILRRLWHRAFLSESSERMRLYIVMESNNCTVIR